MIKYTSSDSITTTTLSGVDLTKFQKHIEGYLGLLPFEDIAGMPKNAKWYRVDDKNIDKILEILPQNAKYYYTRASIPRALDQNILKEKAKKYGLMGESFEKVELAFINAKKNAGLNDLIFIGGSTFVVAEVV